MDDANGLPPRIGIDRPGSFSRSVFHERHPVLIANLLDDFPYPPRIRAELEELLAESLDGTVPAEPPPGPDRDTWSDQLAPYAGKAWNDLPFLWAEAYFYRRLLDAVQYFDLSSPWRGVDPFAPQKHRQLDGDELLADLDAYANLTTDPAERRRSLLYAALWGNQADLGFRTNNPDAAQSERTGDVVVDHSAAVGDLLDAPGHAPVIVVADNAARELAADLALVDSLLETGTAAVELHLKADPFFVSDATGQDVLATLDALEAIADQSAGALATRLREAIGTGRLELRTHGFYTLPSTYRELPAGLAAEFAAAKLVILKGDLNYRRLTGDREWDPATPFDTVASYFPGPVAALRTAKSDLAVGIDPARLAELEANTPNWRTSGTHAVIQVRR